MAIHLTMAIIHFDLPDGNLNSKDSSGRDSSGRGGELISTVHRGRIGLERSVQAGQDTRGVGVNPA
jgi:hypothetical protein